MQQLNYNINYCKIINLVQELSYYLIHRLLYIIECLPCSGHWHTSMNQLYKNCCLGQLIFIEWKTDKNNLHHEYHTRMNSMHSSLASFSITLFWTICFGSWVNLLVFLRFSYFVGLFWGLQWLTSSPFINSYSLNWVLFYLSF